VGEATRPGLSTGTGRNAGAGGQTKKTANLGERLAAYSRRGGLLSVYTIRRVGDRSGYVFQRKYK
jgi:hypothetical protein